MRRRFLNLFSNVVLFLVLVVGVEWWQGANMRAGMWPDAAKTLPTVDGKPALLLDKPALTLVYVFAPWCGVCRATAGNLNSLAERGLNVVSLALSWEHQSDVTEFIKSTGLSTSVLIGSDDTAHELSVNAFPSYFIVSPSGQILKAWSGYSTTAGLLVKMWAYGLTSPT